MPNALIKIVFFSYFLLVVYATNAQVKNESKVTTASRLGLTINNYGTFGRPNVRANTSGPPSMSYPNGEGVDHLFESGIWIGAYVDGQARVSTSSFEASAGYSTGGSGFEFSATSQIKERSKKKNSSVYSSSAVSHQDFLINMTDSYTVVPGTSQPISGHLNPLKASVKLETYNWDYSYANFFVICNYEITNNSDRIWDSVYIGQFADLVVRNIFVTKQTGTAFFNKGRNGVDEKYKSIYAYLSSKGADDINYAASYGALQFLGMDWRGKFFNPDKPQIFTNDNFSAPKVNYNFWVFGSTSAPWIRPDDEQTRYNKLSSSVDTNDLNSNTGPTFGTPSNWLQLLSAGPLRSINPGEKFTYTVAYVCAKEIRENAIDQGTAILSTPASRLELTEHYKRCRATYLGEDTDEDGIYTNEKDLNKNGILDRYVLPEPPEKPNAKIISSDKKVEIYWSNNAEFSLDPVSRTKDFEGYRIYRSKLGDDLKPNFSDAKNLIAQWDSSGNEIGFNNGFEIIKLHTPIQFDEDTTKYYYKYSMDNLSNGWQYLFVLSAFDKGNKALNLESLESQTEFKVFTGTEENNFVSADQKTKVGVYPNPYNTNAAWDGTTSRTRKLYFYNLPARCEITIYTTSGDVISSFAHDAKNYNGEGIDWFTKLGDVSKTVMSGGEHAWDLLSESKNLITQGIYLYSVKDVQSGIVQTGSFAVIK